PPPTDTTPPIDTVDTATVPTEPAPECGPMGAAAEAVPLNLACDVPPQTGTFVPVTEWELAGYNAYGPPVVGQLSDDDGNGVIDAADTPDILFLPNNYTGLVSVNGATGAIQWQSPFATDGASGVAIGDVDGDGVPEIAAANGPNTLVLLDNLGNLIWSRALSNWDVDFFLYPSIADLDGDGLAELIAGRTILDWLGNVVGVGSLGAGAIPNQSGSWVEGSISVAADLDGDGLQEVVTGNAAYNRDGSLKYSNTLPDGCPAIADFDLDGAPEVVMVSGSTVRTLESDLTPTGWSGSFPGNYLGPPAVDDLDGDGAPEFVVVGSNEMRAYRWDGSLLWSKPVQDASGAAGPILFDFEMDGYPEVVYADEEWVRVFNGLDGSVKLESPDHASATGFETPMVADVDNDGHVEIAMLHGWGPSGLTVFGDASNSWPAGRQVWNQHAYSITNVSDDLGIPPVPAQNWMDYNNFRSGDAGLPPSTWNDALAEVVDVCLDECPDRLYLLVRVGNLGTEEIAAGIGVVVRAGEGGPIVASAVVPTPIASGWTSDGITVEVASADLGGAEPWVEVDRDGADLGWLAECDEDNDLVATACP
ncbi:MAG: VCBS repeat-containing protein, partial [Myxococcota bacterium]